MLLSDCEVPDHSIGGGKTLRSLPSIQLYKNWNAGIQGILSVIRLHSVHQETDTEDFQSHTELDYLRDDDFQYHKINPSSTIFIQFLNKRAEQLTLHVEPWANEYNIDPNHACTVLVKGPIGHSLEIALGKDGFTVYGWSGSSISIQGDHMDDPSTFNRRSETSSDGKGQITKVRFVNERSTTLTFDLEPWSEFYTLASAESCDLIIQGLPTQSLDIVWDDDQITLYGWPGSIASMQPVPHAPA